MANLLDFIIISSPRENSFKAVPEDLSSNFSLLIFFIYINWMQLLCFVLTFRIWLTSEWGRTFNEVFRRTDLKAP